MKEINSRNARMWSLMGINPAIWSIGLIDEIERNQNISIITADLARYSGLQRIKNFYPDRLINVGIAEQNMIGIAAGMALEGEKVFCTTYAPFITYRCYDQVRHLVSNLNLDIKLIGSAAGFSAGISGNALIALNDIAIMKSLPNMVVLSPCDTVEAIKMIKAVAEIKNPCYIRYCGSLNIPIVNQNDYEFEIGKAIELRKGSKIAIVATGTDLVYSALLVSKKIEEEYSFAPSVFNFHTIKPLDEDTLLTISKEFDTVITIEEHSIVGGLYSSIAEFYLKANVDINIFPIATEDKLYKPGFRDYMLKEAGLDKESLYNKIKEVINISFKES